MNLPFVLSFLAAGIQTLSHKSFSALLMLLDHNPNDPWLKLITSEVPQHPEGHRFSIPAVHERTYAFHHTKHCHWALVHIGVCTEIEVSYIIE